MVPRDTRTGKVHEDMALLSLERGKYKYKQNVYIGERPGGRKHKIDIFAQSREGSTFLISLKWQQSSGTAEQKVPFEVICLADAVKNSRGRYKKAYLVLGGEGWTLRDFYTGGGLRTYFKDKYADLVEILSLESFVAKANNAEL